MGFEALVANSGWLMIALFILGTILISIELIVPGFGIAGTLGIIAFISGVTVAAGIVSTTVLIVMIAFILIIIATLVILFYRSLIKGGRLSKAFVLKSRAEEESGYTSSRNHEILLDKKGKSITTLRPAGTAEFDDEKIDVVTEGEFIPKGRDIEVIKVEGFKVVVREIENRS